MSLHHAFAPLCGNNPEILILGTFPSPLSRENFEYYGNPRNQFWRLLFGVYNTPFTQPDYDEKKALIISKNIAVWDVITTCDVVGALDSNIKNPIYNTDLPEFIAKHGIKNIFFNGNNAYLFYRRGIGSIKRQVLPSSSPANARMRFEEKLQIWRERLLHQE